METCHKLLTHTDWGVSLIHDHLQKYVLFILYFIALQRCEFGTPVSYLHHLTNQNQAFPMTVVCCVVLCFILICQIKFEVISFLTLFILPCMCLFVVCFVFCLVYCLVIKTKFIYILYVHISILLHWWVFLYSIENMEKVQWSVCTFMHFTPGSPHPHKTIPPPDFECNTNNTKHSLVLVQPLNWICYLTNQPSE